MVNVIELCENGRAVAETLGWEAMDARAWQRRARVVHDAPSSILATYLPLASGIFAKQHRGELRSEDRGACTITCIGSLGLNLALDESRRAVVSVEATCLFHVLQTAHGAPEAKPEWLVRLEATWIGGQCLFMFNAANGWRGCFTEHRLWSSLLLSENARVKTQYPAPTVRGWFPTPILEDLKICVGHETVAQVAAAVAGMGYDGAPDLVLYRDGELRFVEVKSGTDRLCASQVEMLSRLSRIEGVHCAVCCPRAARKRMLATMEALMESDEESS